MIIAFLCIGDRPHAQHCVRSFRKAEPDSFIVQISDMATKPVPGVNAVQRMEYDGKSLMTARLTGVSNIPFDGTIVMIDDDMMINKSFRDDLEGDYDVAIVKRSPEGREGGRKRYLTTRFPYTTGFVVVKNRKFLEDCVKELDGMSDSKKEWWGDMASIKNVIESGSYKVKLLDENKYYRKPEKCGDGNGDTILWHYSGNRKEWMEHHGRGNGHS